MTQSRKLFYEEHFVQLTGSVISALILQNFLYWSTKLKDSTEANEENLKYSKSSDMNFQHGWLYKSANEVKHDLCLNLRLRAVQIHIKNLVEKGWLCREDRTSHTYNKSLHYRVNLPQIEIDLGKIGWDIKGTKIPNIALNTAETFMRKKQPIDAQKTTNRCAKNIQSLHNNKHNTKQNNKDKNITINSYTKRPQLYLVSDNKAVIIKKDQKELHTNGDIELEIEQHLNPEIINEDPQHMSFMSQSSPENLPTVRDNKRALKKENGSNVSKGVPHRLDEDVILTDDWTQVALKCKIHPYWVENVFIRFSNYWAEKEGAKSKKKNWRRTWQNWCLQDVLWNSSLGTAPRGLNSTSSLVDQMMVEGYLQEQESTLLVVNDEKDIQPEVLFDTRGMEEFLESVRRKKA